MVPGMPSDMETKLIEGLDKIREQSAAHNEKVHSDAKQIGTK